MTNKVLNRKLRFQMTKLCLLIDWKFYEYFKSVKILELRPRNRMEILVLRYSRAAKPVSYEITLIIQKRIIIYMFLDSNWGFQICSTYADYRFILILHIYFAFTSYGQKSNQKDKNKPSQNRISVRSLIHEWLWEYD